MKPFSPLFLLLAACCVLPAEASGPQRKAFPVRQADGTTLIVTKQGNEHFTYYITTDGYALIPDAKGSLRYAVAEADGLHATAVTAHNAEERTAEEQAFLTRCGIRDDRAYRHMEIVLGHNSRTGRGFTASTDDGLGVYGQAGMGVVSSIGTPVIPVVMVEFADRKFQQSTTCDKVTRWLNEEEYADEKNSVGSVRDYFTDQSAGMFRPSFEVVARVSLSEGYARYGANSPSGAVDPGRSAFAREALDSALHAGADFSPYAVDEKGVPLAMFIFAGPGEASSFEEGCEDYLWPAFTQSVMTAGGTNIRSYFVGNELRQNYYNADGDVEFSNPGAPADQLRPIPQSAQIDGIGTLVHEFCHALGLPDAYYTGRNAEEDAAILSPRLWSIMDYGNYFADSYAPVGFNAYERSAMGWLRTEELTDRAAHHRLYPFGDEASGATAYVLRNPENRKEYFLLENRQPSRWYPAAMGHGMLITHIDYDATAWSTNRVNIDPARQRFEIIPADNDKKQTGPAAMQGDLFLNNRDFTDTTTPAAKVNTAQGFLTRPLYGITEEEDHVITFGYLDSALTGLAAPERDKAAGTYHTLDGRRVSEKAAKHGLFLHSTSEGTKKIIITQ